MFGWENSIESLSAPLPKPTATAKATPKPALQPIPQPKPKSRPTPPPQATLSDVSKKGLHILNKLHYREVQPNAALVAEVKAFLEDMGKGGNNVSYYVKKAAKYNWPSTELFQAERTYATASHGRKRQKLGGSLPWFASKPVLTQMWRDIAKS